jgi:CRISPR-associated endonuclease/helicase Cas3
MAFELRQFQRQVAQQLLSGRSVILQAPTGAGKTLAAMLPFLNALEYGKDFPSKCLYAVPMRVLANQFVDEYQEKVRKAGRDDRIQVTIQTGEHSQDPRLEASLTFVTIDQVLSSFLHMPYSLPRKQANLNAGAVVASYLVFDEFHLFEPTSTLPTTLEMLRMLQGVTPFLLMTATFSSEMLDGLAEWLGATVIPDTETERAAMLDLPVERSKQRFYHWSTRPLTAEAVLAQHQHRSLVVCNVVGRAQAIYRELRDSPGRGNTEVILLHSRFLPEDRAAKERRLRELFGKSADRTNGSAIAVATQVIEVGLDISAESLHTELAPANAILQRAGRCARFKDEAGHVHIYPIENSLPYRGQEALIQLTAEWLQEHDGERLDFLKEQALVNYAHGQHDKDLLQGLMATRSQHRRRMKAALSGDRAQAGELVRKIVSQPVTISAAPDRLQDRPFAAPIFTLHPGSLQGAAREWLRRDCSLPLEARLRRLEELPGDEEEYAVRYRWVPVTYEKDLGGAPLVAINPGLATYDADEGLILDQGGDFRAETWLETQSATTPGKKSRWVPYYNLESYSEHIRLVYQAFERQAWPELARAAARLEQRAGWPPNTILHAAALAVLFHDVGKLTARSGKGKGWQAWAADWQAKVGHPISPGFLVAHTDYNGDDKVHRQIEKEMGRRPSHAMEGAVAVAPLLAGALRAQPALAKAAFSAIARHHGAFVENFSQYQLAKGAVSSVRQTFSLIEPYAISLDPAQMRLRDDPRRTPIKSFLVTPDSDDELLAYMLLARVLRRADQLGTAEGIKE